MKRFTRTKPLNNRRTRGEKKVFSITTIRINLKVLSLFLEKEELDIEIISNYLNL